MINRLKHDTIRPQLWPVSRLSRLSIYLGLLLASVPCLFYAAISFADACVPVPGHHSVGGLYFDVDESDDRPVWEITACSDRTMVGVWFTFYDCFPGPGAELIWSIVGPDLGLKVVTNTVDSPNMPPGRISVGPIDGIDKVQQGILTVMVEGLNGPARYGLLIISRPGQCSSSGCLSPPPPHATPSGDYNDYYSQYSNWAKNKDAFVPDAKLGSAYDYQAYAISKGFVRIGSIDAYFSLGHGPFGASVGGLTIREESPTNTLSTPTCLTYNFTNDQCEVITNASGLRQVRAPEGLADIVTNSIYKYFIYFYPTNGIGSKNTNGFYQLSGSPLATMTVENPDTTGATTNKLRITDENGVISDYLWQTNGWELTQGGGFAKNCNSTVWSETNTLRTVTTQVCQNTNTLVAISTEKYRVYPIGQRLEQNIIGNGSVSTTNSYTYTTNGLLQQRLLAGGSWVYTLYETNGDPTNVFSSFLDQGPTTDRSLCRLTEYNYSTNVISGAGDIGDLLPMAARRTVDYLLGKEIGRSYLVLTNGYRADIRCATAGAAWNDTNNLVTVTRSIFSTNFPHRIMTVVRPDGTMSIQDRYEGANRTNIVMSGTPDAAQTNIVDGTKTLTVTGPTGYLISVTAIDITSGITNGLETYTDYDPLNRPQRVTFLDGTTMFTVYGCCGAATITNREGTVITYDRDSLQRQVSTTLNSITTSNYLDAAGHLIRATRRGSDSTTITNSSATYDNAGNRLTSTDAIGYTTTYTQSADLLTRTNTYPDGSTRIETSFKDGQFSKITGTAVHSMRYDYGVEEDGTNNWRAYTKEIKLDSNGSDTSEWTKTYRDMLGRSYKTVFSDSNYRQSFYNVKSQRIKEVDPDGVTALYQYNAKGQMEFTATDMNRDGVIDFNGNDRIRRSVSQVTADNGFNVRRTLSYVWATTNSTISNLVSVTETSTDGLRSWNSSFSVTNRSQTVFAGSGNRYVTNTAADGSFTITAFQNGRLISITRKDSAGSQLGQQTYGYDAHGRQNSVTDARNGTITSTFDNADRVVTVTTPLPGTGQAAQTTTKYFDSMGRVWKTMLADSGCVTNEFFATGEIKKTYGARTYPLEYTYDAQGRMKTMKTWKNFAGNSGTAITTWNFDTNRAFLLSKVYDDGHGTTNTYTAAGRLRTRAWARGITTTYTTNSAGEIANVTYSDGATPNVTNTFDRAGRIIQVNQGTNLTSLLLNDAGQILSETLNGVTVTNTYDSLLRRASVAMSGQSSTLTSYGFDAASRLSYATNGQFTTTYSYLANSPLVSQIVFKSNSVTRMTTTKTYDFLNRLQSISSVPSAQITSPISYSYAYNDANQRIHVTLADGSYWIYEYDALGQLISGKHYWSDSVPVAGQQNEYAFDDIGNRTATKAGGDASGANLRSATYGANNLNQYTNRTLPGAADILGVAYPTATVTVNDQTTYRKGEYYRLELSIGNTSAAVWQGVTNKAILSGTNTTNGSILLPKTPELFAFDADGNEASSGQWTNTWDAENRLVQTESLPSAPTDSKRRVTYVYDSRGRMARRTEYDGSSGSYVLAQDWKFVYDGWNSVAELNSTNNSVLRSYVWGLDLSGSLPGAGGVGGLLAVNTTVNGTHFYAYDGNGNVATLVSGADGTKSGRFEHGPFAEVIRVSGVAGSENAIRWSTKFADPVTSRNNYGYRWLGDGRWLSRDPIGLRGGVNEYTFVRNNAVNHTDLNGLKCCECVTDIHISNVAPYTADPIIGEHIYGHHFKVWITLERKGCGRLYPAGLAWWEKSNVQSVMTESIPDVWGDLFQLPDAIGPGRDRPGFRNWVTRRNTCPDTETLYLWDNPGQTIGESRILHILVQVFQDNACDCQYGLMSVSALQLLSSEPGPPPLITEQSFSTPDTDQP